MSIAQLLIASQAAAGEVAQTWDPGNKGTNVVLSNGDLTAAVPNYNEWAFSTGSKSSGKWYFEIYIDAVGFGMYFGVQSTSQGANSAAINSGTQTGPSMMRGRSGGFLDTMSVIANGSNCGATVVVSVAVDLDAYTLLTWKNNSSDSDSTMIQTPDSPYKIAFHQNYGNGQAGTLSLRTTTAEFTYSPPSGYQSWGSS